jgi:hypothetical protein
MRKIRNTASYDLMDWQGLMRRFERKGSDYRR